MKKTWKKVKLSDKEEIKQSVGNGSDNQSAGNWNLCELNGSKKAKSKNLKKKKRKPKTKRKSKIKQKK